MTKRSDAAIDPRTAAILERVRRRELTPEEGRDALRELARTPVAASDVAIVGMSARFPGADDVEAFWRNLSEGRDSITGVPRERWDAAAHYDPDPAAPGKCCGTWGGFLSDVDRFDPRFFNLSPKEAELMDPQQRLFLEEVWKALEDAGLSDRALRGARCSVFAGCKDSDYRIPDETNPYTLTSKSTSIIPARVSYFLDLRGPSVPVNTACSSALVAIALACDGLRAGASDVAVAGGVALMMSPRPHLVLSQAGMLSPRGRCRAFDQDGDGIVPGEGVAAVVLKRLGDALRDGDRIHGVIKGYGTNHDGKSNGITAPSGPSQTALEVEVYERFGIHPETITLVEAHGTGTKLGDPIEVHALTDAFRRFTGARGFCALGSVKTNIGHTLEAAGMAGLIKILLSFRHRTLVPSLHFERENEHLDLPNSPFYVNTETRAWSVNGPRRAALSAFGMNGTNAHLVLEEPPPAPAGQHRNGPELVVLSAKTEAALERRVTDLAAWAEAHPEQPLGAIAATLQVGRSHFAHRLAVVVPRREELAAALQAAPRRKARKPDAALRARLQELLKDADRPLDELAALYLDGADVEWELLHPRGTRRIALPPYPFEREVCWIPQEQTATLATGIVVRRVLHPDEPLVAGHRVDGVPVLPGVAYLDLAWTALAGVADAQRYALTGVVWARMLAVDAPKTLAIELRGDDARIAVEVRCDDVLHASGTFVPRTDPEPVPMSVAAIRERCPATTDRARLYEAATKIRHGAAFQTLGQVRIGDGEALGELAAAGDFGPSHLHPGLADGALQIIAAVAGDDAELAPYAVESVRVLRPLPARGWTHVRASGSGAFDVTILDADGRACAVFESVAMRPLQPALDGLFHAFRWELDDGPRVPAARAGRVVIVHEAQDVVLAHALAAASGGDATLLPLEAELPAGEGPIDVYFLGGVQTAPAALDDADACARAESRGVLALFRLIRKLLRRPQHGTRLTVVTSDVHAVDPAAGVRPFAAAVEGMARALAREYPEWVVRRLDVAAAELERDARPVADAIVREQAPALHEDVALRGGRRWVRRIVPATVPPAAGPLFRRGGVYLIAGGAGGLGMTFARHLVERAGARVALLGRSERRIDPMNGHLLYVQADLTDRESMRAAIARVQQELGPIRGVVHSAIVLADRSLATMSEDELLAALAPKTRGSVVLYECVRDLGLDWLLFFSSVQSFIGNAGQANYAAACTFKDAFARAIARENRVPVRVLNWGYWANTGIVAGEATRSRLAAYGVQSIEPAEGLQAIERALGSDALQTIVFKADDAQLRFVGIDLERRIEPVARAVPSLVRELPGPAPIEDGAAAALRALLASGERLAELGRVMAREALRGVAEADVVPAYRRLYRAAVELAARAPSGDGAALRAAVPPDLAGHLRLLSTCCEALPHVLTGRRNPMDVLFPGGSTELVEPAYRGDAVTDFHNAAVARAVRAYVDRRRVLDPEARVAILEIGAGTGSTSRVVLPALDDVAAGVEYHYTDVSLAFVQKGESLFSEGRPYVRFAAFDVERDPAAQGFAPGTFDLIIASNVLHATRRMPATLGQVKSLLARNGVAVINEISSAQDFATLTFGLTSGWWLFEDESLRIAGAPLLDREGWRAVLHSAGFRGVRMLGLPETAASEPHQTVILAESDGLRLVAARSAMRPPVQKGAARPAEAAANVIAAEGAGLADYVKSVLARVLKVRPAEIEHDETFEAYGVDSLVVMEINKRFAEDFGPLPATLLFEHMTVDALTGYFARTHPEVVQRLIGERSPRPEAAPVGAATVSRAEDDRIAIIGIAGRYPMAADLDAFWENLAAGRDCVREIPPERWNWREGFDPAGRERWSSYSRWGGFLDDVDRFDELFFNISPKEAAAMDPQERLFLETAWRLLENAGIPRRELARQNPVGVFVGVMNANYEWMSGEAWAEGRRSGAHSSFWSIANRVSFICDLQGPSLAVDTACSSSLTAIHLACESLRRGECGVAIAGGVNLVLTPVHYARLCAANMLAKDGRCKSFGAGADGIVDGEGVGAVLLKPLARALEDGDRIEAVISGSWINAGGRTSGYTVPNPNAQAELIRAALRRANVDPRTITYLEAHGTGTALGDPVELAALGRAFGTASASAPFCALGSVKANVGHLESAAGIAGLTKVVLQLRHRRLAPTIHCQDINPHLDFAGSPFRLQRELAEWQRPDEGTPRRAGVSSFGAGGANAHVIVEEWETPPAPVAVDGSAVVILSARAEDRLRETAAALATFLARNPNVALADVAYTLQVGREAMPVRAGWIVRSAGELRASLERFAATGERARLDGPAAEWVAGNDVDWKALYAGKPGPRRIALPGYAFARNRHWMPERERAPVPMRDDLFFVPERSAGEVLSPPASPSPRDVVIVHGAEGAAIAARLAALHGGDRVRATLDGAVPDVVYFIGVRGAVTDAGSLRLAEERGVVSLLRLVQSLPAARAIELTVVTDDVAVASFARSLTRENAAWRIECVDLELRRVEWSLLPAAVLSREAPAFRRGGVYWVIGGAGAVGRALTRYLAETHDAQVICLGRPPRPDGVPGAVYVQADVADAASIAAALRATRERFGAVHGVFHCAMDFADRPLAEMDEAALRAALRPKTVGALVLRDAFCAEPLDFLVFFSSAQAFFANRGRAHYAAACAASDALAAEMRATLPFPVISIAWGFWGSGVVESAPVRAELQRQGVVPLDPVVACDALERILALRGRLGHVAVLDVEERVRDLMRVDGTARIEVRPAARPPLLDDSVERLLADPAPLRAMEASLDPLPRFCRLGLIRTLRAMGGTAGIHPRYARLARALDAFAGAARAVGERELEAFPDEVARWRETTPAARPYVDLLLACLDAYPRVLTGSLPATEVLFPGGSSARIAALYRDNAIADYYNTLLAQAVRGYVARRGPAETITIVEVGAGIGGTTAVLLPALAQYAGRLRYLYTDVAPAFVQHGKTEFGPAYPFAEFLPLDLERDVEAQQFALGEADVVVAANVMHATRRLRHSLQRAKALLAPNGWLVLNEMTDVQELITLTFGLLDGWWAYEDEDSRMPHGPLASWQQWRALLSECGFRDVRFAAAAGTDAHAMRQHVIIAASDGVIRRAVAAAVMSPAAPAAVAGAPAPEAALLPVETVVARTLASVLGLDAATVDRTVPFATYGVDSISALELVELLNRQLGVSLRAMDVFTYSTVAKLGEHIGKTRPGVAAASEAESPANDDGAIAIIGISGRFPGAANVRELWRNLAAGRDAVGPLPAARRALLGLDDAAAATVTAGGFLDGIDEFDPLFFHISPKEAELMDPQQRLFLQEAWHALEDAGYAPESFEEARCGVFVGCEGGGGYQDLVRRARGTSDTFAFTGNARSILPARVAYALNLRGPGVVVDTACSSSLVALHQACESLRSGTCDAAIAGGVNLLIGLESYDFMLRSGILSSSGRCRPFDRDADGIVPSEAVCAVVVKPLAAAVRDGDHVYGVIRGTGINQDGRSNGITAPSALAQAALLRDVYRRFGIDPATIGFVEAHGTGTALGDPIELAALADAFGTFTAMKGFCALGSVKSNLGHAFAASGLTGLAKVLLALRGAIPPSLHYETENGHVPLADTPFVVNTSAHPWPDRVGVPRRAALSSFGFSGTNAHAVVEEFPESRPAAAAPGPVLIALSAKTPDALRRRIDELAEWLASAREAVELADVGFTLLRGRAHYAERAAFVAGDVADLLAQLRGTVPARLDDDARAYLAGRHVEPRAGRRIPLPGYPFARERYWIAAPAAPRVSDVHAFTPEWVEAGEQTGAAPAGVVFLIDARHGLRDDLERRLGCRVRDVAADPAAWAEAPEAIVCDAAGADQLTRIVQRLASLDPECTTRILCTGRADDPRLAAAAAFGRSLAIEEPRLRVRAVALGEDGQTAAHIAAELRAATEPFEVRYRDGRRQMLRYQAAPVAAAPLELRRDGAYVVSGGSRGIGLLFAEQLVVWGAAHVVVLARTRPDPMPDGVELQVADVTRRQELERALAAIRARHGAIRGVVHAAGVTADARIARKHGAGVLQVVAPKVDGARHLDELTASDPLDFFVLFSSISAVLGNLGQTDYAFANGFLDRFAAVREELRRDGRRSGRTRSIGWSLWRDGGMQVDERMREAMFATAGLRPLETGEGFDLFRFALQQEAPHIVGAAGDAVRLARHLASVERPPETRARVDAGVDADPSAVIAGLRILFGEELGLPAERIDPRARLQHYGIESLLIVQIQARLERALGTSLPKTLLFEHQTLHDVAVHLAASHPEACARAFGTRPQQPAPRASRPVEPGETRVAPPPAADAREPVAIIGLAGRYPGAPDLPAFWRNLRSGVVSITEIPRSRWDYRQFQREDPEDSAMYCRWGGFLDDVDKFDPLFFNISPREAELLDPQERLFLEIAWAAVEDAGYTRERLRRVAPAGHAARVGVFVGVTTHSYALLGSEEWQRGALHVPHATPWSIPNRVSWIFNLAGESMPVDTACSSSLVALHHACESVRRDGGLAIAGGVNLYFHPSKYVGMCSAKMLSRSGRCRSFGEGADGFVPGEGVGAVLLKPLSAAVRDGDPIYGVVLGTAVNHGGRTNGYTVPNPTAQQAVIEEALARSGVSPRTISYVEAHGTGTALGDPIEVAALTHAYESHTADRRFCALGSVKPNIGHLESAAGIAGLTKVLLQFRHRELVPTLHADPPNANIDFAKTPFTLQRELAPWTVRDGPLRAAVSSFGAGGTNAHAILEEWVPAARQDAPAQRELIVLSARTADRLAAAATRLADHLETAASLSLADVARTLRIGREPMEERLAIVTGSMESLVEALRAVAAGRPAPSSWRGRAAAMEPALWTALRETGESATLIASLIERGKLDLLAQVWVEGAAIDWPGGDGGRCVPLPSYPFARMRCWLPAHDGSERVRSAAPEPMLHVVPVTPRDRRRHVIQQLARKQITVDEAERMLK